MTNHSTTQQVADGDDNELEGFNALRQEAEEVGIEQDGPLSQRAVQQILEVVRKSGAR